MKNASIKHLLRALVAAIALVLGAGSCQAFGPEGHAMIADMAQANLTAAARAQATRLLALEGRLSLDDVSSWADDFRVSHRETGPFHYVDIPLSASGYDEGRDCHYDQADHIVAELTCVVAKLPEFAQVLADRTRPDKERLVALKWVVHLVGDIHQPLHAQSNNDRGGNNVHFTYFAAQTNLHAIWDGDILRRNYGWAGRADFTFDHVAVRLAALALHDDISASQRADWAPEGLLDRLPAAVTEWATESHALAPDAYAHLGEPPHLPGWEPAYQTYAWPVMAIQLKMAAARLAQILDEALK